MQKADHAAASSSYRRLFAAFERFVLARSTWLGVLIVLSLLGAA